jgi:uncharacterized membrane protein YjgN (DUF898 family)
VPWRTEKLAQRITAEQSYAGNAFGYARDSKTLMKPFAWIWTAAISIYAGMMLALAVVAGPHLVHFAQTRSLAPLIASGIGLQTLAIVGLAMVMFYGIAKVWMALTLRHQARCTHLGSARFTLQLPIAGYVWMASSNLALRIISLGVLTPWCELRHWRFLLRHLEVVGPLPRPPEVGSLAAEGRR